MTHVLLVHQPTDGGVGRHIRDLANGLSERGYEVTVCGPRLPVGIGRSVGHRHLDLRRAVTPLADGQAVARLVGIVRELRPDIVHAHSSKAGALARLGHVWTPRIPVVYTPHGYAFAGYFSSGLERHAYRSIERVLAPLATRVICVCEAEGQLARAIGPASRVCVIHNGIHPVVDHEPDPAMEELGRHGPVICALTYLRPGKGLETLIDAVPSLLEHHPQVQVAIVGEGPELDALQARARQRTVAQAVHFLRPSTEPLTALRGMTIFVHPSWADAFPYVILEAMSAGLPIVACDVGGIGEAILDGESGLLVPPRQSQALAQALTDLLDDGDRRARLGEMAFQRVNLEFTLERMLDRLIGVYTEVMSHASATATPKDRNLHPPG